MRLTCLIRTGRMRSVEITKGLNRQQLQAVTAESGPILVLAGPGSGKTRVLTHRIAYLIGMYGVRSYHILAVTFTNKAAREMENRVQDLLGEQAQGLTLGTFHAICARILRREAEHLPFDSNFVIFDSDDQLSLVRHALDDLNLDEKRNRPQAIHAAISNAKNELLLPDDFPVQTYRDEVTRRVYSRYQQLLLANNALDFDDLLLWTALLLEDQPSAREKYARRYQQVLVDEFQDTNMAQYSLLKHLASFHSNIFVVGDTDQSIYRWRGADYRNITRFEEDFPTTQVVLLEQNYRSTQAILDVAMAVIDRNPYRVRKRLFTERGAGQKAVLYEAEDDLHEASFIIDTISTLTRNNGLQPGNFAVMYRTNAQSRVLEEAFLRANLPYKLVGAQRFYGRREIKDIIAFLRLTHNPSDEISLIRAINLPPRGIGDKTILQLRTQAGKAGLSPGEMLLDLGRGEDSRYRVAFSGRVLSLLAHFGRLLATWHVMKSELSTLLLMDRILGDVGYRDYIDDGTEEGNDRWENVMELRRLASQYQGRALSEFLEDIALVSDQDTLDTNANVPTLLTLHAAKGLEFPIVMIVGLVDGLLPHIRSFDEPEAMQEERRLFYVGITRAKDRLYLVYPQNRSTFGHPEACDPSRFLEDIPAQLLSEVRPKVIRRDSPLKADQAASLNWRTASASQTVQQRFRAGMRVQHPTFGEGIILNSRIQDDDEIVDIFFEDAGLKKLAVALARLNILP